MTPLIEFIIGVSLGIVAAFAVAVLFCIVIAREPRN